ncbi:hypothetical protein NBRC116598_33150 [Pseudophaeobacter arcticus]|uniref:Uncharacterized protein n=1 Tax=Pseudophaeobacter arcticus TaxID=385492 RepID=A0ABQ0APQ6_9RHOB
MTERTCPICEGKFTAQRVTSLTCGAACSNKAKKLRSAIKAFNEGKRELRPATLEQAMRLLEADEVISAAKVQRPQRVLFDDEVDDPAEDRRWRNAYARRQAIERKWMRDWREANYRLALRYLNEGKRLPMWMTERFLAKAHAAYPGGLPPLT